MTPKDKFDHLVDALMVRGAFPTGSRHWFEDGNFVSVENGNKRLSDYDFILLDKHEADIKNIFMQELGGLAVGGLVEKTSVNSGFKLKFFGPSNEKDLGEVEYCVDVICFKNARFIIWKMATDMMSFFINNIASPDIRNVLLSDKRVRIQVFGSFCNICSSPSLHPSKYTKKIKMVGKNKDSKILVMVDSTETFFKTLKKELVEKFDEDVVEKKIDDFVEKTGGVEKYDEEKKEWTELSDDSVGHLAKSMEEDVDADIMEVLNKKAENALVDKMGGKSIKMSHDPLPLAKNGWNVNQKIQVAFDEEVQKDTDIKLSKNNWNKILKATGWDGSGTIPTTEDVL